jgi:secondary thiamine-phosphate synthase enzyme
MTSLTIRTATRCEMIDITGRIAEEVRKSGSKDGICHVFFPPTTAAITINENADPYVQRDILTALDRFVPLSDHYRHAEGNAAAHINASLFGASKTVFIKDAPRYPLSLHPYQAAPS